MDSISLLKVKLFADRPKLECPLFKRGSQIIRDESCSNTLEIPPNSTISYDQLEEIIENAYLLFPAVLGTVLAYLVSLIPDQEPKQSSHTDSLKTTDHEKDQELPIQNSFSAFKLLILIYVLLSIIGIGVFIYRSVMGMDSKNPFYRLLPIGIGLFTVTFLFASVNLALFVIFPTSFTDHIQPRWLDMAIDFFYYSALGLTTGAVGDILPTESTTRLLLAMEGMVNLIIFSLLIASIL